MRAAQSGEAAAGCCARAVVGARIARQRVCVSDYDELA
jgi:hypothetical protein